MFLHLQIHHIPKRKMKDSLEEPISLHQNHMRVPKIMSINKTQLFPHVPRKLASNAK